MRKTIVGAAAGLAILFTAAGVQAQGMEDVRSQLPILERASICWWGVAVY